MAEIKPAIVAVGYNRPDCMKRLLTSIVNAEYTYDDITLIISIDECEKSCDVQTVAEEIEWTHGEKIIRRFPERQGLKNHILQCGDLAEKYGAAIVLEDDLYVSRAFYSYAYKAINFYSETPEVACIALYSPLVSPYIGYRFYPEKSEYDSYFGQYTITWGECWSSGQWKRFRNYLSETKEVLPDFNEKIPTEVLGWKRAWSKYFINYIVNNSLFYSVPYTSLTTNFMEDGEHAESDNKGYFTTYQVPISESVSENCRFPEFSEGIKYDAFFERVLDGYEIEPGVSGTDVCVDLYGTRVSTCGKGYLLTCKNYNMPLIRTYGLKMRPVEANVLHSINGKGINLYQIDKDIELIPLHKKKNYYYTHNKTRIKYEVFGMSHRQLTGYVFDIWINVFLRRIKKLFGIKKRKK